MPTRTLLLCVLTCSLAAGQSRGYSGPRPPKPDLPYLLHASRLVETEAAVAQEERKKNDLIYYIPGTSSPARTPLAEPIFLIWTEKLQADRLELYRVEVKNGRREVVIPEKKRGGARPYPLSVRKLADGLWRVEAGATLENGQYSLTPAGSNSVFLFEVY